MSRRPMEGRQDEGLRGAGQVVQAKGCGAQAEADLREEELGQHQREW